MLSFFSNVRDILSLLGEIRDLWDKHGGDIANELRAVWKEVQDLRSDLTDLRKELSEARGDAKEFRTEVRRALSEQGDE